MQSLQSYRRLCAVIGLILMAVGGCIRPESFTVVLLPDTQNYSEKYPEIYMAQTEWIKSSAKRDNTKFVIHLGDIVNRAGDETQWQVADRAHRILDGVVPYSVVPGNHDMDHQDGQLTRETTLYNKYFPPSRFERYRWYGGHMGRTNANNYGFFEGGGTRFMVVSLEFAPSDQAIEWAHGVIDAHKDRQVILATHSYLTRTGRSTGGHGGLNANSGENLWNKLVRKHENVFMVVCGHISGTRWQTSTNDAGRTVHEIMFDYQNLAHGGDGWLVPLRFMPADKVIRVQPYSPVLKQYNTDPEHMFMLDYDVTSRALRKAS